MVHTCNPSTGGRGRRITNSRPIWTTLKKKFTGVFLLLELLCNKIKSNKKIKEKEIQKVYNCGKKAEE
jgi:hypothetical protein